MTARTIGLVVAVLTLSLDQAFKAWMLWGLGMARRAPLVLTPFFDLRLAWNPGISYSLFRADSAIGRFLLVGVALVAAALLAVWLARTRRRLTAVALGLLIGGALGNAWDRAAHGAVADFFHLHFGDFAPFGVFNLADVAITTGVGVLLLEALLVGDPTSGRHRD